MEIRSLEQCFADLQAIGQPEAAAPATLVSEIAARDAASALISAERIDPLTLSTLIIQHPDWVPLLASCVGLGLERLKRWLRGRFNTEGWITLARRRPLELLGALDEEFRLLEAIQQQREKAWSFGDILVERARWSRQSAVRAGARGRALENFVEQVVRGIGLSYAMRTSFAGRGGETAPCDVAIPAGGEAARIVIAVKGFNSTGSKLTDARREIETMANVRQPNQFVFAFIDGRGWHGRQADFRRIHELWATRQIDGLYSQTTEEAFLTDLTDAAQRVRLL